MMFSHILRFLHFCYNINQPDKTNKNYDRLWKIRSLFDILNDTYAKSYNSSQHLTVDEIAVQSKAELFSSNTFPRNKHFGKEI
jgi:hypothetical protein